jgi:hypothetical protein
MVLRNSSESKPVAATHHIVLLVPKHISHSSQHLKHAEGYVDAQNDIA